MRVQLRAGNPAGMDLSEAYENGAHIEGAETYPERWAEAAEDFRASRLAVGQARLGLRYGPHEREAFDLFVPSGRPAGLVLFLHGGYWKAFGRESWSHLAAGPMARDRAVAIPSYPLAPEARIGAITRSALAAARAAADAVPGAPLTVTGHSAGGHLAARIGQIGAPGLARVVPISPLSDLAPLMRTAMNEVLRIDSAEARAESPARGRPLPGVTAEAWVGEKERAAFLDQARWLSEAWEVPLRIAPGRHHFDVIEPLEDGESPLTAAICH